MAIDNIYSKGIASGWQVFDAADIKTDQVIEADVAIIGSGAGGATAAEIFTNAGLDVVILDSGPLQTSDDFKAMDELKAYADLYQDGGGRTDSDGAIAILQGRAVGGSTVVNWTTSLRTPKETLQHWSEVYGVEGLSRKELDPWFEKSETRLGIEPWAMPPNANNDVIEKGAKQLGWSYGVIPRNVKGCWNLGYCGMGCPTNAKQSMLTTSVPAALKGGAKLYYRLEARRLKFDGTGVNEIQAQPLNHDNRTLSPVKISIKAPHHILAGGAINNPALLLRSEVPDPYNLIGTRTTIHPVNASLAWFDDKIDSYYGAPQSRYSDHFLFRDGVAGQTGYKLEAGPAFPALTAGMLNMHGEDLQTHMRDLPKLNLLVALLRDGFNENSKGGSVRIDKGGSPVLDYKISTELWDTFRHAQLAMAEMQFAAGAQQVKPSHLNAALYNSWRQAKAEIEQLKMEKHKLTLFSAHLMGGCWFGSTPENSVCDSNGRFHHAENLYVLDGSLFPTSLGVNPQLSIYGVVSKLATKLAAEINAKKV